MPYSSAYYVKHRERIKAEHTRWRKKNMPKRNAYERKRLAQIRLEMIEAYGGQCVCCKEQRNEFLTIDHINGNGNKHRNEDMGRGGGRTYAWLKRNNWPKDNFRLLCFNCNCARGFFGYCPHERENA